MNQTIYPIGIQNFEKIRKDGYLYIDKTALIYQLVKTGSYYFLSRPRRFGKSLLLSTIEAYALGKKDLFKGLALEKLEKDWTVYPVLHLDLNTQKYDTPESLTSILNDICAPGKTDMAHVKVRQASLSVFRALSAVPANRPDAGW